MRVVHLSEARAEEDEGEALKGAWLVEKKNSNWHVRRIQSAPGAAPAAKAEEAMACSL
ncbi:MAG: hypothetical protein ACYTKD_19760 [Planctomycetota bacterium]